MKLSFQFSILRYKNNQHSYFLLFGTVQTLEKVEGFIVNKC